MVPLKALNYSLEVVCNYALMNEVRQISYIYTSFGKRMRQGILVLIIVCVLCVGNQANLREYDSVFLLDGPVF